MMKSRPHMTSVTLSVVCGIATALFVAAVFVRADEKPKDDKPALVDYATQIKPIFAEHCHDCHSASEHKSGFRLDTAALALRGGDRGADIVPGKSDQSLLYQAITGAGDVAAMPADSPRLSTEQIALIKRWIDEGAKTPKDEVAESAHIKSDHWAFQSIKHSAPPDVADKSWVRNPIDAFVLARLEAEGLKPSPPADRATLIRRLSLDLCGITPTPAEVDHFLHDQQPAAYERLVDRMLASPHYGELWGRHWLDVARYADSNGFTIDSARSIWKYRDWVIDAYNRDLPFDQFTIEQLAGDLLPDATTEQLIATGFHRNTLVNEEGGTDKEQFRIESIHDRVNTTGAAYLGLSVGCAQCHAHKYDPISQREYYEFFALFNNCDEPNFQVPTSQQAQHRERLTGELAAVQKQLEQRDADYLKGLPAWEAELAKQSGGTWTNLDPQTITTRVGSVLSKLGDQSLAVDFSIPANDTFTLVSDVPLETITAVRLEALTHASLPMMGPGRAANGNFVLSEFELEVQPLDASGNPTGTPQRAPLDRAIADHSQVGYPAAAAIDGNQKTGWSIDVDKGSLNIDREATFLISGGIHNPHGSRLTVHLHQNHSEAGYLLGRFRLSASSATPASLEVPASVRRILAIAADKRSDDHRRQLEAIFKESDPVRQPISERLGALKNQLDQLDREIPTTLIMHERTEPRETHIHIRGDFLRHGARVTGSVPAVLPPLPADVKNPTRLDLARWLVDPVNPLTARVTVNRVWQPIFGVGLVQTENDFGTQGSPPSHPELLDWLAGEYMRLGWSTKSLLRLIVTSATYQQSSELREELHARDPANRLLARQSRIRLEAETIRDVCLSASGLLTPQVGGPSVYPPQPEGIYVLTQQKKAWPEEQGPARYRRGMYTYFWRSSPYPFLPTFDAPDANTTCTRRVRSNTPLQALSLANDHSFVEIARGLAGRIVRQGPAADAERLRFAFRLCLAREPHDNERDRLMQFLSTERQRFAVNEAEARPVAPLDADEGLSLAEGAAWTAVARVLMNLDEFITRE
ncbi:MAG: DUF1553 domain-containing protein [Planctomycetaceae bacterium]